VFGQESELGVILKGTRLAAMMRLMERVSWLIRLCAAAKGKPMFYISKTIASTVRSAGANSFSVFSNTAKVSRIRGSMELLPQSNGSFGTLNSLEKDDLFSAVHSKRCPESIFCHSIVADLNLAWTVNVNRPTALYQTSAAFKAIPFFAVLKMQENIALRFSTSRILQIKPLPATHTMNLLL